MILWPNHLSRITNSEVASLSKIPSVKQTKWKLSWWKTYLSHQNTRADKRCLLFLHSFFKLLCINIWQYLCHNSTSWYLQRNLHPCRTCNASALKFLCIHSYTPEHGILYCSCWSLTRSAFFKTQPFKRILKSCLFTPPS